MKFGDDPLLLVGSPVGLQLLIDHTAAFSCECSVALKNAKSHTVM